MWTPLGVLRNWVRRQAYSELSAYVGDAQKTAQQEVQKLIRSWPSNAFILVDDEARGGLGEEIILLDHNFRKPATLGGYIDLSDFEAGESCRIRVLVRFDKKEDLVPLYSDDYSGPVADCVSLHEQPVVGRVQVTYQQILGKPQKIYFKFFGGK